MEKIEGKKGVYILTEPVPHYPMSQGPLDKALFGVFYGELENKPAQRFLIKKITTPTRLQSEHYKIFQELSKFTGRSDIENMLRIVDVAEKDNRVYAIQEIDRWDRLTKDSQLKEINIVNFLKEISKLYNQLPNLIFEALANKDMGYKELDISHILYNKYDYTFQLDLLNFHHFDHEMKLESDIDNGHIRSLGLVLIQLLYKKNKGSKPINELFDEEASKENGVVITNLMKNLIRALLSKNPPSWEKLTYHPLICPLEGDYETWKIDYVEDDTVMDIEKNPEEENEYFEIKNYKYALDQINDVRTILIKSKVVENFVKLLIFLLLKCISLYEKFLEKYQKNQLDKKKKKFHSQSTNGLLTIKLYYQKVMKKDYEEVFKNNTNEWFTLLNEIDFDLGLASDKSKEWMENLQKQNLNKDIEKVFNFLKSVNSDLASEMATYSKLIK